MTPTTPRFPSLPYLQVLVVDDDEFMLTLLPQMLRALGVQRVDTAAGGTHGLAAYDAAAVKPDVVLCDLHMPGTDGFQFMEELAARRFAGGIILISGTPDKVRRSAALMARFHRLDVLGSLGKPIDLRNLADALSRYSP